MQLLVVNTQEFCGYLHVLASLKHRSVLHYGYRFDYTTCAVDLTPLPQNIPVQFMDLVERLLQQNIIRQLPDQLTVNQYQPGQGKVEHLDVIIANTLYLHVIVLFEIAEIH